MEFFCNPTSKRPLDNLQVCFTLYYAIAFVCILLTWYWQNQRSIRVPSWGFRWKHCSLSCTVDPLRGTERCGCFVAWMFEAFAYLCRRWDIKYQEWYIWLGHWSLEVYNNYCSCSYDCFCLFSVLKMEVIKHSSNVPAWELYNPKLNPEANLVGPCSSRSIRIKTSWAQIHRCEPSTRPSEMLGYCTHEGVKVPMTIQHKNCTWLWMFFAWEGDDFQRWIKVLIFNVIGNM